MVVPITRGPELVLPLLLGVALPAQPTIRAPVATTRARDLGLIRCLGIAFITILLLCAQWTVWSRRSGFPPCRSRRRRDRRRREDRRVRRCTRPGRGRAPPRS